MAAKHRTQPPKPVPAAGRNPAVVVVVGSACLLVGLGIGYYFGGQHAAVPAEHDHGGAPAGMPGPVVNPADILQQETALKSALASNPKDLNLLIQLGNLYYDHQRWADAIDYYGRALDIDPKNANARTDRGTAYWNLNQPDAAIAEFNKSLQADPAHAQTLYNLGVVYLHGKNDVAEARKAWQALLATNPNYPERAKVEQQLSALSAPQTPAAPAGSQAAPASGVEDLLERMKARKD